MTWSVLRRTVQSLNTYVSSPELLGALSPETADALSCEVQQALAALEDAADRESGDAELVKSTCAVAGRCVRLGGEVQLTAAAAAVVREGLAVLAAVLPLDSQETSQPRVAASLALEALSADLDTLVVQLYISLCRIEASVLSGEDSSGSVVAMAAEEALALHYRTLQGVVVWTLAILARAVGYERLNGRLLWEWANSDPFCIFVLVRGLLAVGKTSMLALDGGLNFGIDTGTMPLDLHALQDVILSSVLDLSSPIVVFLDRDPQDGNVAIAERNTELSFHRSLLAAAAAECGLVDVLIAHLWSAMGGSRTRPGPAAQWSLLVASFLASLASPPDQDFASLREGRNLFIHQLQQRSAQLWLILGALLETVPLVPERGFSWRGFLCDCATLAFVAPPANRCRDLIRCGLVTSSLEIQIAIGSDGQALAALMVCAANGGLIPGGDPLAEHLATISAEVSSQISRHLGRWRGPVRADALQPWAAYVAETVAQDTSCQTEAAQPLQSSSEAPVESLAKPAAPPGLREMLQDVPPEFCCSIDGKLLVDPVRSPHGQVYERSVLERALTASTGLCPATGMPLALTDCPRAPELRAQIVRWVRESRCHPSKLAP